MKKAFKAFTPADKLYNINRINSKLIHYSAKDDFLNSNRDDVLSCLNSLKEILYCFNTPIGCNRFVNYLQSIEQLYNIIDKKKDENTKQLFCYMTGCFERFRNKYSKSIHKLCEREYHGICIPLFSIELNNKKAPNNGS